MITRDKNCYMSVSCFTFCHAFDFAASFRGGAQRLLLNLRHVDRCGRCWVEMAPRSKNTQGLDPLVNIYIWKITICYRSIINDQFP
jgi:hypothetical protein